MNYQRVWNIITDTVANPAIDLVYFGIGSAMEHYKQITLANNQQYPCFLDKFEGNKMIVLFDTHLEVPLKIEEFFEEKQNALEMVNLIMGDNDTFYFRHLRNNSGTVQVLAVNDLFDYEQLSYSFGSKEKDKEYSDRVDCTVSNLINLISVCLGKRKKTKVLLQDYTGRSVTNFYTSLFNVFDREELISHVMFDVTQKDPGCFFEISTEYPVLDSDGNFLQETFMRLTKSKGLPLFNYVLKQRIDHLIYPLSSNYVKYTQEPDFELHQLYKIITMFKIYNVEFNDLRKDREYLLEKFKELIDLMLHDIVRSQECDISYVDHFARSLFERNQFISLISVFKFTDN